MVDAYEIIGIGGLKAFNEFNRSSKPIICSNYSPSSGIVAIYQDIDPYRDLENDTADRFSCLVCDKLCILSQTVDLASHTVNEN